MIKAAGLRIIILDDLVTFVLEVRQDRGDTMQILLEAAQVQKLSTLLSDALTKAAGERPDPSLN